MTRRTWLSAWILGALIGLVLIALLVTPSVEQGAPYSSYSAGADGVRLARDLVGRLGWKPEAREVAFTDSLRDPAPIQVLVNANVSDREAGDLLRFVRAGGSVLVAGSGPLEDSLGLSGRGNGRLMEAPYVPNCMDRGTWRTELTEASYSTAVAWNRPLPRDTVGFGAVVITDSETKSERVARAAIGMPLGAGRIVVLPNAGFLANDVLRRCEVEADVAFVRMIQYLSRDRAGLRVAFDEYHHGYGTSGGSMTAIRTYLAGTPSGRLLAQMAVGGLLLLFAAAPRPLAPRDPTHIARRSPLEHADALAHAYAGVRATRTAAARLLAGVRRRARSRGRGRDTDEAFLAAAASLSPAAAKSVAVIAEALESPVPDARLPQVAAALDILEHELNGRTGGQSRSHSKSTS